MSDHQVVELYRQDWRQALNYDIKPFVQAFSDLGLGQDAIQGDVEAYLEARKPLALPAVPEGIRFKSMDDYDRMAGPIRKRRWDSFSQTISDLIARREYLIEDSEIHTITLPLFWLTCPTPSRSKVQYNEEVTEGGKGSWKMTVLGTGMGSTQSVSVTCTSEFEATEGECKSIFVAFPLRVYLIGIYEKGVLIGRGLRSEVPEDQRSSFTLGIKSATDTESDTASRKADLSEEVFQLSGDSSKAVHTFSRMAEGKEQFELKSGLRVFELDLSSKTEVSRTSKIKLTFKLPAGFDYRLKYDRDGSGIWWR